MLQWEGAGRIMTFPPSHSIVALQELQEMVQMAVTVLQTV
jgi:hypothetical protein